jgi:regulator of protease activity HflC (stomatin/prohibitin superfamily)
MCYSNIQFLQLRSVDLPNPFEDAIQESEVKKQDIKKAEAELNKVKVEVDTRIKSAEFQKNVTINIAEGEASAILQQNKANVDSFNKIQNSQSEAYKILKNNLQMNNQDLLKFIKTKLVKNYDGNNMALTLASPEPTTK